MTHQSNAIPCSCKSPTCKSELSLDVIDDICVVTATRYDTQIGMFYSIEDMEKLRSLIDQHIERMKKFQSSVTDCL